MLFVCYPKCSTCMKAKKWLDEKGIEYLMRDIKTENPNAAELKEWWERSGLPLKKFFNTRYCCSDGVQRKGVGSTSGLNIHIAGRGSGWPEFASGEEKQNSSGRSKDKKQTVEEKN